jgi:hypothetical protein
MPGERWALETGRNAVRQREAGLSKSKGERIKIGPRDCSAIGQGATAGNRGTDANRAG